MKKIISIIIIVAVTIFYFSPSLYRKTQIEYNDCSSESKMPVRNLVINIPEPCKQGSLTIGKNDDILYAYLGEIKIINDGNDGNPIEIFIEYPGNY